MIFRFLSLITLFSLLVACSPSASSTTEEVVSEEASTEVAPEEQVFGEAADFTDPMVYGTMVNQLMATPSDTMDVTVKGTVNEVCQAKGCWMTMDLGRSMLTSPMSPKPLN